MAMEFEQRIYIAQQERPWVRTCWSIYDGYTFDDLQKEYRKLTTELILRRAEPIDIGIKKMLLQTWGENPSEEAALDLVMARKESQLNCIGLRLEYQYLLATDSINWFR